jgi:hypothetical protein
VYAFAYSSANDSCEVLFIGDTKLTREMTAAGLGTNREFFVAPPDSVYIYSTNATEITSIYYPSITNAFDDNSKNYLRVEDIDFESANDGGVKVAGRHNIIQDCSVKHNSGYGVMVTGAQDTIRRNSVQHNYNSGGIAIYGDSCFVRHNLISTYDGHGIVFAYDADLNKAYNNIIRAGTTSGITVYTADSGGSIF